MAMADEARVTMICIDIGMTGSAASWRDNRGTGVRKWKPFFNGAKIPTTLAYDTGNEAAPPVAWGKACSDLPPGPHITFRECFKASMDEHSPLTSTLESQKWSSHAIDQRCMLDFMNLICEQITAGIDSKHGVSWKNATIQWIFSVPGSWAELPTVANSKRLAEDAIYRCIGERPGSKVFTSPTETRASAHCLLKNGSVSAITAYAPVSRVEAPELLNTPIQLDIHPAGGATVDRLFVLHVRKILETAGAHKSREIAQQISWEQFHDIKTTFTPRSKDIWVTFDLPIGCEVRSWCPSEDAMSIETRISQEVENIITIMIHRDTMTEFFTPFVEGLEQAIDEAINRLNEKNRHLTAIGICGGGSRMAYPIQRLRQRYGDGRTFLDHTNYGFPPEMAAIQGSTMLCDQQLVRGFCEQMRFGIKRNKDGVFWGELTEVQTPSDFQTPYSMEVHFNASTRTMFKSIEHDLIALSRSVVAYSTFSEASRDVNARTWKVKVDVAKVKNLPFSLNKKYKIICKISGVWKIETVAEAGAPTERIDCSRV